MKTFIHFIRYIFHGPFGSVLSRFPPGIMRRLARILGSLAFRLKQGRVMIAARQVDFIFRGQKTSEENLKIIRRAFQVGMTTLLEAFYFPRMNPENIAQWIVLDGSEHLDSALSRGRGALIILVHFGSNQMVMAALGHRGYTINQLGSRPDDWNRIAGIEPSALEKKIFQVRFDRERHLPANFIYIDRSMRPIYQRLKNNEIMIMAADGRAGARFIQADFSDRIMNLSSGPFRISRAMDAPLIPVFPVMGDDGVHRLVIQREIDPEIDPENGDWVTAAAREFGQRLEEMTRQHPDHYCMLMTEAAILAAIDEVPLFEENVNA